MSEQDRTAALENLYQVADNLSAFLGYHGQVCADDAVADDLLDALNALDIDSPHQITALDNLPVERKTPSVKEHIEGKIGVLLDSIELFERDETTILVGDMMAVLEISIKDDDFEYAINNIEQISDFFSSKQTPYSLLFKSHLQEVKELLTIAREKLCQKN